MKKPPEAPLFDWAADRIVPSAAEARQRRDTGMRSSVEHADDVSPSWSDRALALVAQYAQKHPEFMAEDAREYAHKSGLPVPPDGRAWGAVIQRAHRAGLIMAVGYAPSRSSNQSPKVLWGRP